MSGLITGYDNDNGEWYAVGEYFDTNLHDTLIADIGDELKFSEMVTNDVSLNTSPEPANQNVTVETLRLGPPDRNTVETPFNFTIEIESSDTKKKYLYSHRLHRIYVDKEYDFSVKFNWNSSLGSVMWVRACVVFADEAQAQKRPQCCLQHLHQDNNTDVDKHIGLNVLHSSRPKGTQGVEYRGCADVVDSWLSTVVALSKPGPQCVAHAYKFICKSSCSSGINRRAIAIIFTLEDSQGTVYGRQMVGARVCSCPRRDLAKDEESEGIFKAGKKRVPANMTQPRAAKKTKIETVKVEMTEADDRVNTLPPLDVIGDRTLIAGLETMVSMTQQALAFRRSDPQAVEKYEDSIAKLHQAIQNLKNKPPSN